MSTNYPERLPAKLNQLRRVELDYSEAEMANALGVSASDVLDYENGTREVPLLVLLKYARSVGVSTDILIDDAQAIRSKTGKW